MEIGTTISLSDMSRAGDAASRLLALDRLCEAGFRCLDYNFPPDFADAAHPFMTDGWQAWCDTLRERCEGRGAKFIQSHSLTHNYFAGDAEAALWNDMVDRCILITARLGADVIVMHPVAPPGKEYDADACLAANRDFFRRKAEFAAKQGVRVAAENMLSNRLFDGGLFKRCCTTSAELLALVEAIDMENVGVCVDVGHMHYQGEDVGDGIRRCSGHLLALHLHDNDRSSDQHIAPYSGTLDWEKVYAALSDIGYRGCFTLEVLHACEKLPPAPQLAAMRHLYALADWMQSNITQGGDAT